MAKSEIRAIARKLGLKVADKADSQEICFVPGQDYKAFLRSHLGENQFHRGGIYDLEGNFVAAHEGIEMFTIGQRKGLPGGSAQPRYVVDLDPETNRVIVGSAEDLLVEEFEVERVNWICVAGVDDLGPQVPPVRSRTHRGYSNRGHYGENSLQSSGYARDGDAAGTAARACSSMRAAKGDYTGTGGSLLRW
jgi:Predicted tRNA(5-methylaminomethyl-2-thiouridylate) methyltransferase, contains the PP-loop ATPase domain